MTSRKQTIKNLNHLGWEPHPHKLALVKKTDSGYHIIDVETLALRRMTTEEEEEWKKIKG